MNPEQQRILADLLIEWEDLYHQGTDSPAEILCKDHPELTSTLARQIAALKRVAWLDKKFGDDDGGDPDCDPFEGPRPPKVLAGRYRLDELIATGGFAEVWRAFDQELQRIIAIKIPKKTIVGSAEAFLAEARRVAKLKHPAILPVYDVGQEDDNCFFVSEFVEGGSLAHRLTAGNITPDKASHWILSIADALAHAHDAGVIHRDIKPANILIDQHDRALLADFGIAQSAIKEDTIPSTGTLRYMAPEQLAGQSVLPQSDLYSLAVVLHEATTGKPPYPSSDPNSLRRDIARGAVISRDLPHRLIPVCRKALQGNPALRHRSATEFANELRKSADASPRLIPVLATTATVVALLMALSSWWPAASPTPSQSSASATASKPPPLARMHWTAAAPHAGKDFLYDDQNARWIELKPDGTPMAYYRQVAVTNDYIGLLDASRNLGVRLWADRCEYSCTNTFPDDVGILAHGYWTTTLHGPLPPRLYDPITLVIGRNTFAAHLEALSKATDTRITADRAALQRLGITINQLLELDALNERSSKYLDRLLAAIDPQHRLTLSCTQSADGTLAVTVTTKDD